MFEDEKGSHDGEMILVMRKDGNTEGHQYILLFSG